MILDGRDIKLETMDRPAGIGGQHVPASSYGVKACHLPTGLEAVSRSERSNHRNREVCLAMLQAGLDRMQAMGA